MKAWRPRSIRILLVALAAALPAAGFAQPAFRPPAVPLVTHDPYFSIWSTATRLTDEPTRHWTGTPHALAGLVRIDGKPYRIIGHLPADVPALAQTAVTVHPLRTVYTFEGAGVRVTLTFLSPMIPQDLELVSRPVSYLAWEVRALDGRPHDVALYLDASAQIAVNTPQQPVNWGRTAVPGLQVMRAGTVEQPVLAKTGDNLRIDWGWFYLAVPDGPGVVTRIAADVRARASFVERGTLPAEDDGDMPRAADDRAPVLAAVLPLGRVAVQPVAGHALLAYDDEWAVEFLEARARAWWRRGGLDAAGLLRLAESEYAALNARSERFDADLTKTLEARGRAFADVAILAFRQTLAAHKLVAHPKTGQPLYFSKENFSNGCMGTVDVTYPSSPFFLVFNPALLEAQLRPVLEYASLPRWRFPYAPHDLGRYPKANGQVYGGGEKTEDRQMPVEESGNMLIMLGALAVLHDRVELAREYWPVLGKWIAYLEQKGFDPENQLSTDDFAGHLARNANLSIKAIAALGVSAELARRTGQIVEGARLTGVARAMVPKWIETAGDGDHFRLAFDKPGTWSQKYNLVWDRLLGLQLFPAEVAAKEIAFYRTKQLAYGLPLDNRSDYTKADWIVWTATLATTPADFTAIVAPVRRFLHETPDRIPFTDWYYVTTGQKRGFQARSVVGGVYIPLLDNRELIGRWSSASAPGPPR